MPEPSNPTSEVSAPRNMFEKIWDEHLVDAPESGPSILYIDLHLVHEVTSPQAFEGLRLAGRLSVGLNGRSQRQTITYRLPIAVCPLPIQSVANRLKLCEPTARNLG